MAKKLITAGLCASIVLSNVATATEKTYLDVDANNTTLMSALDKLHKLSIVEGYDDGTFKPDNNVTRAEFAVMTRRLMNPDGFIGDVGGYTLSDRISDMLPWHFAITEVNLLKKMRIISGYEDGSMKPEQGITYCEGIKMLVCALGYNDDAIKKGGWSDGYIECAKELGLLKDIAIENYSAYATREASAIMINNALSIPRKLATVCDVAESIADTPKGVYHVDGVVTETTKGLTFGEILNKAYEGNENVANKDVAEEENSLGESALGKSFSQEFYGGGIVEAIRDSDGENMIVEVEEDMGNITIHFEKANELCDYFITLTSVYDSKYYRMPSKEEFEQNSLIFADLCPPNVHKVGPISTEEFTFSNVSRGAYRLDVYSMPCMSTASGVVVVEGDATH